MPGPRTALRGVVKQGMLVFAANIKRSVVISDIVEHTVKAVQWGEAMGGWKTLTEQEILSWSIGNWNRPNSDWRRHARN